MKQAKFAVLLAALLLLLAGTAVVAQISAGFNLAWNVVGSGGGESSSASYHVNGTIGQGVASPPVANSASFTLSSGYRLASTGSTFIYLPLVVSQ